MNDTERILTLIEKLAETVEAVNEFMKAQSILNAVHTEAIVQLQRGVQHDSSSNTSPRG